MERIWAETRENIKSITAQIWMQLTEEERLWIKNIRFSLMVLSATPTLSQWTTTL